MSIEDNKRLVAAFNSHFARSDIPAILDLLADDATWWINGRPDLFPITGMIDKATFAGINRSLHAALDGGLRMEVVGMNAEGERVAAELRAHAVTKEGRVYDNDYHMLYTIRGGLIVAVREYTDLMAVAEAFALPGVRAEPAEGGFRSEDVRRAGEGGLDRAPLTANKRSVADFLAGFERSDVDALLDAMTDDATWWVNGRPDLFPDAGVRTRAEMGEAWRRMFAILDQPLRMQAEVMVEEGDRVVAQVRSHAVTRGGKIYQNGFLIRFTLRSGRVADVREYTDLLTAADVFG